MSHIQPIICKCLKFGQDWWWREFKRVNKELGWNSLENTGFKSCSCFVNNLEKKQPTINYQMPKQEN